MGISRSEPIMRGNLLALARAYAEARGVKMVTISTLAYGEAPFFDMLITQERIEAETKRRAGRKGSFTVRKYDEVVAWFESHWPQGVLFPQLKATPGVRDVQSRRSSAVRGRSREREAAATG